MAAKVNGLACATRVTTGPNRLRKAAAADAADVTVTVTLNGKCLRARAVTVAPAVVVFLIARTRATAEDADAGTVVPIERRSCEDDAAPDVRTLPSCRRRLAVLPTTATRVSSLTRCTRAVAVLAAAAVAVSRYALPAATAPVEVTPAASRLPIERLTPPAEAGVAVAVACIALNRAGKLATTAVVVLVRERRIAAVVELLAATALPS